MDTSDTTSELKDVIALNEKSEFVCQECENTVVAQMMGENGKQAAPLAEITQILTANPAELLTTYCSVCGMEYQFKLHDGKLGLIASDEEK